MENLALKVVYKGKIIIIGKGIRTEQSIVNHLQKRFNIPQQQINLFSLQYEDEAQSLNEAYLKAFQKGKQSVRIKIQQMKPEQKLLFETESQSKRDNVTMLSKENDKGQEPQYIEKQKTLRLEKMDEKEEPHVVFEQSRNKIKPKLQIDDMNKQDESNKQKGQVIERENADKVQQKVGQERYFPLVAQISQEQIILANISQPQSTEVVRINNIENNQVKDSQSKQSQNNLISAHEEISPLLRSKHSSDESDQQEEKGSQQSQSELLQDEQHKNQIEQTQQIMDLKQQKSLNKFPIQYQVKHQQSLTNDFRKNESQSKNIIHHLQYQNQQQDPDYYLKPIVPQQAQYLITESVKNLKIQLQKQFDTKLSTIQNNYNILEKNHEDLQQKYHDLLQKYQSLALIVQQYMTKDFKSQLSSKKEEKMEIKPLIQGYEKIPYFDPAQQQEPNYKSQPQVQIQDLETRTQIQVGQVVRPQYFLVNTGKNKWPKNVVAVLQNMQTILIKSLEPNGQYILQMKRVEIQRVGEKIKKIFRLGYYNKKGDLKLFGRKFGVNIVGVDRKMLRENEKNAFNFYILELMSQKGIKGKDLKKVVDNLRSMMINEENYKQADRTYLAEIIKYM